MKKLLLSLVITVLYFSSQAGLGIGPRFGVNFSNISNGKLDSIQDIGRNLSKGTVAGLALNIPIPLVKPLSVQAELLFSQKGVQYEAEGGPLDGSTYKITSNYAEVPVVLKARLMKKIVYGYIEGGAYWAAMLNQRQKVQIVNNGVSSDEDKSDFFEKERDNRIDVGVVTGIGVGLDAGIAEIELNLRYNIGLYDRIKKDYDFRLTDDKQMNRTFGISLLCLF